MSFKSCCAILIAMSFFAAAELRSSEVATNNPKKPTLELGVALGGQYLADYRGSGEYSVNALPVPFFIYRGGRFKVDRKGMRGDLLNSDAWEFNVSGEISLSSGDNDNDLREGMPELDSAFEIGPSFNIALDGNVNDDGWMLRVPLRTVFAAGSNGIEYIGYLANPKLTFTQDNGDGAWRFSSSLGFSFGSERYHDYYYQVDSQYVTEDRGFYDAKAGYSGAYFKTSASKRSDSWHYGVSLRYDNISGTEFAQDSPLVETEHYFAVSFILAKYLWASDY